VFGYGVRFVGEDEGVKEFVVRLRNLRSFEKRYVCHNELDESSVTQSCAVAQVQFDELKSDESPT
jgi:hypothetical protein